MLPGPGRFGVGRQKILRFCLKCLGISMTFEKHRLAHNLTMSTRLLQGGRLRGWVGGMAELFNIP